MADLWHLAQMKYDEFKAERWGINTSRVNYNWAGRSILQNTCNSRYRVNEYYEAINSSYTLYTSRNLNDRIKNLAVNSFDLYIALYTLRVIESWL